MVTVILDMADNGVVKTIEDDNINGAGEPHVSKYLYTFEDDNDFKNRMNFLKELCLDIGLQLGSTLDPKRLNISVANKPKKIDELTHKELTSRITAAEKLLQDYKKQLEKYETKS
tara:strand:- start:361 stop:705 length:345 start_codon:yes stop_codon:yes gene_type:complete